MNQLNVLLRFHYLVKSWFYVSKETDTNNVTVILTRDERDSREDTRPFFRKKKKVYREVEVTINPRFRWIPFLKPFYKKGFRFYKEEYTENIIRTYKSTQNLFEEKYTLKYVFPNEKIYILTKENLLIEENPSGKHRYTRTVELVT